MKKVYISGKISGLERSSYMAHFSIAEQMLRKAGYISVCNPTKKPPCQWPWLYRIMGYNLTLLYDLWLLLRCDLIYKIPGWQESHGANIESCVAYHLGVWPVPKKTREKIDKRLAKFIHKEEEAKNEKDNQVAAAADDAADSV